VADAAEAARQAGFVPHFPDWDVLGQAHTFVELGLYGAQSTRVTLHVADLRNALRQKGISDLMIPEDWEGVEIEVEQSPVVYARVEDSLLVAQLRPFHVIAPAGFPIGKISEICLRLNGMPAEEARSVTENASPNVLTAAIPPDADIDVREVALTSGPGVLIKNRTDKQAGECMLCPGPRDLVLAWVTSDRVYIIRSPWLNEELAIKLANSIR
jgi:hypothetical protein